MLLSGCNMATQAQVLPPSKDSNLVSVHDWSYLIQSLTYSTDYEHLEVFHNDLRVIWLKLQYSKDDDITLWYSPFSNSYHHLQTDLLI